MFGRKTSPQTNATDTGWQVKTNEKYNRYQRSLQKTFKPVKAFDPLRSANRVQLEGPCPCLLIKLRVVCESSVKQLSDLFTPSQRSKNYSTLFDVYLAQKSFPHLKAGWTAWPIAVGRGLTAGKGTITVVVYGHSHCYHCCRPLSTLWKETKYTGCTPVSIALESHILTSWFAYWK